jgi:RND family efflux transporter MFP subunit
MTMTRLASSAALLLLVSGCAQPATEEVVSETVVPVTTAAAMRGTIRATIHATGTVTPAPGADLVVIAPQPARIAEMPKAEGDPVRTGDLLVRFEIPQLTSDVASRQGEVERARARLENARAAQTRAHDLFDRGIAARKEMEDADRELSDAQAGVTEAQATLASAESAADRTVVRSTFNGIVARRMHNPGDLVDATAGDPVLRVVDPRRLEVTAAIPIPDVARIDIGASARLSNSAGDADTALTVVSRPAAVQPNTATAPVRLRFTAPTTIPVGSPVQVSIDAEEHRDVVLVPAGAVVHEGEETAVFVVGGDKAVRRMVTLGIADETRAEIRSGVMAGETVIVSGQAGLPDGAQVTVTTPEPAP